MAAQRVVGAIDQGTATLGRSVHVQGSGRAAM
jgi:hypothetical protein